MDGATLLGAGEDFAGGLAVELVKIGAKAIKGLGLGDPEARLLEHCCERALTIAIRDLEFDIVDETPELRTAILDNLRIILAAPETLAALSAAALAGGERHERPFPQAAAR